MPRASPIFRTRYDPIGYRLDDISGAACRTANRRELRQLCDEKMAEITGIKGARMMWDHTKCSSRHRKIIFKYEVDVFGWPENIPFASPGAMSVENVGIILRGFRSEKIVFGKLNPETLTRLAAECGDSLHWKILYAGRNDTFEKRGLRPPETASKRKRQRPVKTAPLIHNDA